jgi:hypothetical protein
MKPVHVFELDDDIKASTVQWFRQQLREFSMEGCISQCVSGMPASLLMETVLMTSAPFTRTVPEQVSFERPI